MENSPRRWSSLATGVSELLLLPEAESKANRERTRDPSSDALSTCAANVVATEEDEDEDEEKEDEEEEEEEEGAGPRSWTSLTQPECNFTESNGK